MMKKLLCVLAVMILAGCQALKASKPPVATYASTHPATEQEYLVSAVTAIQVRFYDADLYRGRECNLRLHQVNGNLPDSVTAEGGDPKLCEAAIVATKQAIEQGAFPYRPSGSKLPESTPFKIAPQ